MSHDKQEHDPAPAIPKTTSVYLASTRDANLPTTRARQTAIPLGARACRERRGGAA